VIRIEILQETWTRALNQSELIADEMRRKGHMYRLMRSGDEIHLYTQAGSAHATYVCSYRQGRLTCMSASGSPTQSAIGLALVTALLPSLQRKDTTTET